MTIDSIIQYIRSTMVEAIGMFILDIDTLPTVDEMFTGVGDDMTYMVTITHEDVPVFVLDYTGLNEWSIAYADLHLTRSEFTTEVQERVDAYVFNRIKWYKDNVW